MLPAKHTLIDTFGRVHNYLRLSLTERCNLRCTYCMPEEGIAVRPRSMFMTREEVLRIAEAFVSLGVTKIRLTGGEPLVRRDAKEVIESLSKLPVELAITTNGVLVHDFIDTFISCGIRSVNVSLDTFDHAKSRWITRRDHFATVRRNIELLVKSGFKVKLNAVIMRGVNDDELPAFVAFTKENKVHFRFIEFMPFEGNRWDRTSVVSHREMIAAIEAAYPGRVQRTEDGVNDTARNYMIEGFAGTFGVISTVTDPFCASCNRVRLTADGKLKNCLFSKTETDLLFYLREGMDVRPLILASVWGKEKSRGGMTSLGNGEDLQSRGPGRSMQAIGG